MIKKTSYITFASTFIISLFILGNNLSGQTSEFTFFSKSEEEFFENKKENLFDYYYTIGNEKTTKSQLSKFKSDFESFTRELNGKIHKLKHKKKIQILYKEIHDKYFQLYSEDVLFYDIFLQKKYNCLTATALYSLACQIMDIPFEIRQEPTHVYLIAYPESDRIIMETTLPSQGLYLIKDKHLEMYKRMMVENKYITHEEASSPDFYERYFLNDKSASTIDLIGFLYHNSSILFTESEDFERAFHQAEKANSILDTELSMIHMTSLLSRIIVLEKDNLSIQKFCHFISKLENLTGPGEALIDELPTWYSIKADKLIRENKDFNLFQSFSNCVLEKVEKEELKFKIQEEYDIILGFHHYQNENFEKAFHLTAKYHESESFAERKLEFAQSCFMNFVSNITYTDQSLDTIAKYENIYPFLKNIPSLNSYKTWALMKLAADAFDENHGTKGSNWISSFEQSFDPDENLHEKKYISWGYSAAAFYALRKGKLIEARNRLNKGLKYDPYNSILTKQLNELYRIYPHLK
ncbi:MAG: hypothetical protein AAF487_00745 [Bacteroidota bacterium]